MYLLKIKKVISVMHQEPKGIDFSTVLASAVHDMKNSLCLLLQSIESLNVSIDKENEQAVNQLASAHYEASRLNTGLVQLLSLYRAEMEDMPVNIDECYIDDLFDELLATNENYIKQKHMDLKIDVEEGLCWYLDGDLINLLLNDVLVNAMRYSNSNISLSAHVVDNYLEIKVEDDGAGYPQSMLEANDVNMQEFDISQGRTGLGLFFAKLIANAHQANEKSGQIALSNGGKLGGSVFTLKLP